MLSLGTSEYGPCTAPKVMGKTWTSVLSSMKLVKMILGFEQRVSPKHIQLPGWPTSWQSHLSPQMPSALSHANRTISMIAWLSLAGLVESRDRNGARSLTSLVTGSTGRELIRISISIFLRQRMWCQQGYILNWSQVLATSCLHEGRPIFQISASGSFSCVHRAKASKRQTANCQWDTLVYLSEASWL